MKTKPQISRNARITTACAALVTAATLYGVPAEAHAVEKIQRYCVASWRNAGISEQEWNDCTQTAMERLLERVEQKQFPQAIHLPDTPERRELNRAIWCTIQRWRRAKRFRSLDQFDVAEADNAEAGLSEADESRLQEIDVAMSKLTATQQQVLKLWSEGEPIRKIATELNMTASRASDHKYKALKKLKRLVSETA